MAYGKNCQALTIARLAQWSLRRCKRSIVAGLRRWTIAPTRPGFLRNGDAGGGQASPTYPFFSAAINVLAVWMPAVTSGMMPFWI